ncbi:FAD-dependent monooxygenase [Nonomuraea jiangxiensis]|uniref:2-polyprenyl-6-methoxyphenol hydroxylase n=1 Tax=Nonomuraea jiangxiensis TaxID=633440 RepID=A0A1G8W423_9ACTN|nr:FAD-dependent monooxygenase [Nonomuraea jiangxiensis]SDJ73121.1 2-polyprenyl-6-methoxyphenol hydroxylase [Nonomuraea jiangxiensis]
MVKRAVIVGAGIAGLAAALRLHRIGWEPVLVERAPARRTGGYVVAFFGRGYDAAERMGVLPALRERHSGPVGMTYLKPDGRHRYTVPSRTVSALLGERGLTLMRGDIEAALYEQVDGRVPIRFGTTLTAVRQHPGGVHIELDDGATIDADLLVGADGLHSKVRELVFGPEEGFRRDLGHMIAATTLDHQPPGAPEHAFTTVSRIGHLFTIANLGPGRTAAFFTWGTPDPAAELAKDPRQALAEVFHDIPWTAAGLIASLPAGGLYYDSVSQIVSDRWSEGRVVLLGDAAWCVTLFAGYGSSLAVAGAESLGTFLESRPDDVPAALRAWEADLRPEAEKRQALGRRNSGTHSPASRLDLLKRDLPLRLAALPPVTRLLGRRLRIHG